MFCTVKESAPYNLASSVSKSSVFCQIETPRRRARRGLRGEGKVIGYLWWVIGRWKNRPLPPWRWFPTTMPQSSRSSRTRKPISQLMSHDFGLAIPPRRPKSFVCTRRTSASGSASPAHDVLQEMIALRISINDVPICVAGASDLCVLNAIVNAVGPLGPDTSMPHGSGDETPELFLHVGGLTSRVNSTSEHLRWVEHAPLAIGDSIQITLCEVDEVDVPIQTLPQVTEVEQAAP